jgi:hypothetical protein
MTDRASSRDAFGPEMARLVEEGRALLKGIVSEDPANVALGFSGRYQTWYTRCMALLKHLAPERLREFTELYERDSKRKHLDVLSYALQDYIQGVGAPLKDRGLGPPEFDVKVAAYVRMNTQVDIVASVAARLDDILSNIRGVLQAGLFDSELDAARHLKDNGHLRAAGAVAGVVLEGHLAEVCSRHGIKLPKKEPHISDYNEALRKAGVLDVPQWRGVQRMADIRNLCDHKKKRDPMADEVDELIDGVDKATKTLM